MSLLLSDINIDDTNWYFAKDILRETYKGREVLNYVDNHLAERSNLFQIILQVLNYKYEIIGFIPVKKDVSRQAKAYVGDLVSFIDVANKENKRILEKTDLI